MRERWNSERGRLICTWADVGASIRHSALSLLASAAPGTESGKATLGDPASFPPPIPDFAAHSPFGSGEWLTPWNARWRVQARR